MPARTARRALSGALQAHIEGRFRGWNLDAALRYLPIASYLDRHRAKTVLDVGSGDRGLSLYRRRRTIALDLRLETVSPSALLCPVRGSVLALPFPDRSVDAVVCSDVLEHLAPGRRPEALSEMVRVAQRHLILGVPCGPLAERAERSVNRLHAERTGEPHAWLREHLAHGLPAVETLAVQIRSAADSHGRRADLEVAKNVNLRLWRWLYRRYVGGGPRTARLIRHHLLVLLPLLRRANWGEPYRRIFYVALDAAEDSGSPG